jgi:hypothetical protein
MLKSKKEIEMPHENAIPDIERPSFFKGQRLKADDLNELHTFQRELRWLHNRTFHMWGIALGMEVTGKRAERVVRIGEGVCIDCLGREIILTHPMELPIPPVSGIGLDTPVEYLLIAQYQDQTPLLEMGDGNCAPSGSVRFAEEPLIYWEEKVGYNPDNDGLKIILAEIKVIDCQLAEPVSLVSRRSAHLNQPPYIFAGSTDAELTNWEMDYDGEESSKRIIGIKATVDTSSAQFRLTPKYMAEVRGIRTLRLFELPQQTRVHVVNGPIHISDPTPVSFTLHVLLPTIKANLWNPQALLNGTAIFKNDSEEQIKVDAAYAANNILRWHIIWQGIE